MLLGYRNVPVCNINGDLLVFFNLKKVYPDGSPEQTPMSCVAANRDRALDFFGKKLGNGLSFAGPGQPDFLLEEHNESNVVRVVIPTIPVYITPGQALPAAPPL
jgi:hypothetical protein